MSADRDEVYEAQHARLLEGLAASIRKKGLAQTQVTDIVGHARASRRTFYKHFPDKDSCFVELTDAMSMLLLQRVDEAIDREAPLEAQIDRAIDTYVDILLGEPNLTATWASPSVGDRVIISHRPLQQDLAVPHVVHVQLPGRRGTLLGELMDGAAHVACPEVQKWAGGRIGIRRFWDAVRIALLVHQRQQAAEVLADQVDLQR